MSGSRIEARRGHKPDYLLGLVVFGLLATGLVMMYSISPILSYKLTGSPTSNYYFNNHLLNVGIGIVAWIAATNIDYRAWKRWAPALVVIAAGTLVALLVPGLSTTKNGATRWLALGPLSFQPSELLKLAMILYLGVWFERRADQVKTFWDGLVPFGLMMLVAGLAVVIFQRNLSTMLVLGAAAVGMYFVAGIKWRHLVAMLSGGVVLVWVAIITFPHRLARLVTFLNPSQNLSAAGYQLNQALIAIGSGGLFGLGLGKSIQVHGYLPEVANDSIFAIIAEEFGLIGAAVILGLFVVLVLRGLRIAREAPDTFGRLVATGITLWLFVQALINLAAMMSLIPLTGIPLPFISYGGSSLVISLVGAGILMNISKYSTREESHAPDRKRRGDGWSYLANSSRGRSIKVAR